MQMFSTELIYQSLKTALPSRKSYIKETAKNTITSFVFKIWKRKSTIIPNLVLFLASKSCIFDLLERITFLQYIIISIFNFLYFLSNFLSYASLNLFRFTILSGEHFWGTKDIHWYKWPRLNFSYLSKLLFQNISYYLLKRQINFFFKTLIWIR